MTEAEHGCGRGGVTRHTVSKGLTAHAVLLVSVDKRDVGPLLHVIQRAVTGRDALDQCATEGCVCKLEGLAVAMVSSRGESILSRVAGRGRRR